MSGIETAELWCVDLGAAAPALHAIEQRTPRLCPADRSRAASFSDARVRDEWLATHIALRLLIERAAGARWRGATFNRAARGKPQLDGAPLGFSISHAPGLALIGLSPVGSIGVDIERTRGVRIAAERRARIEAAGAALSDAPLPSEGIARFLQAWVRLEAVAKAEGCGIGRLLTRLGILGTDAAARAQPASAQALAQALRAGPQSAATVQDVTIGADIFAAAALGGDAVPGKPSWLPVSIEGLEKLTP
ncbi:MAG: phosphopantetheinyl transferase [Hyphomicrobium sp.]|nr:phosphopantetheinyl transferase [Hyphomicrobium sp.]